jgi:hypothetical protein
VSNRTVVFAFAHVNVSTAIDRLFRSVRNVSVGFPERGIKSARGIDALSNWICEPNNANLVIRLLCR